MTNLSQDQFDQALIRILRKEGIQSILQVPGVYELLAEAYNNEALDLAEEMHGGANHES